MFTITEHEQRRTLAKEVHSRPFALLHAPERATHIALLCGEGTAQRDQAHLGALCRRYGAREPAAEENFYLEDVGPLRIRWERHTEFVSLTFFEREPQARPRRFAEPVLARVPADWLRDLPGELIAGVHLEFETPDTPFQEAELPRILGMDNFAGSLVTGGAAQAWMSFAVGKDLFSRVLVRDRRLTPRQAGRLVQRLLEIETYRMMALLALPLARRQGAGLSPLGQRLTRMTAAMNECERLEDERALLDELTRLSAEVERIAAATTYRFGAARAYHALVERRIGELREARMEGYQTLREFMERRMSPAMQTCEAVSERLDRLSRRVSRASQLLRTRVDLQVEAQNRDLLASMNRRAKLQLRLQSTVEGLSIAAVTYYGVSLVGYGARALHSVGLLGSVSVESIEGAAIPLVAGLIWLGMRRIHRLVARETPPG